MHPDGDELLILLSGRIDLVLDEREQERTVNLRAGKASLVPRGVGHRGRIIDAKHERLADEGLEERAQRLPVSGTVQSVAVLADHDHRKVMALRGLQYGG